MKKSKRKKVRMNLIVCGARRTDDLGPELFDRITKLCDNYDSCNVDRFRLCIWEFGLKANKLFCHFLPTVPHRDVIFLAGSEDQDSLSILFELTAQACEEESRLLSPLPLRLVDGQWEDWVPAKDHVLRDKYDELELRFLGGLYKQQKELLDVLFRSTGVDAFVASFLVSRKADSENLRSCCSWARYARSLLPKTQFVALVDGTSAIAVNEWDHVAEVVGPLLIEDDSYYPTRYEVTEFPSPAQLAAIGRIW